MIMVFQHGGVLDDFCGMAANDLDYYYLDEIGYDYEDGVLDEFVGVAMQHLEYW